MSVLIKGFVKPKSCEWVEPKIHNFEVHNCPLLDYKDNCSLQDEEFESWVDQMKGCPLVELPAKHGRLIDADEITAFKELERNGESVESLDEFPTVIEAEGE